MGRVVHLLQIDGVDLVRAHRTHIHVAVAPRIQGVVGFPDGKRFHHRLLNSIDDLHAVPVADWNGYILTVRGDCTLVGASAELHHAGGGLSRSIYDPQRVIRLDGHEQPAAVRLHAYAVDALSGLDVADYLQRTQIYDTNVIASAVSDIQPKISLCEAAI